MNDDRLAALSDGRSSIEPLTPSVSAATLRLQLAEAWAEIKTLRRTVAHQARLLEVLASETSPAAPSINACYWLFSDAHRHGKSWRHHWNRLKPTLDGLGTVPAPDLTPIAWERHRNARRSQADRHGQTPCEHTLNIELQRAKGMLDWAVDNQLIQFNPLKAAKYVKTVSRRETELHHYDVDRMLIAAEDLRDRRLPEGEDDGLRSKKLTAFILLCFESMLRFEEARGLDRDAISPTGDVQVIGKGDKKRTVTLTSRTLESIRAVPGEGPLFPNGATTIRGWFRWACEHGRLDAKAAPRDKRIVPHHLRHAGATEADAAGVRPSALQLTLGHSKMATTERYLHRDAHQAAREVAEAMERRPPQRVAKVKK